jgi:hypothetical protein
MADSGWWRRGTQRGYRFALELQEAAVLV